MINNNKPIVIFFEGLDKTGKSTLLNLFNKETNYKYLTFDRGFISSLVYDKAFKRNNNQYYENVKNNMLDNFNVIIIYCFCKNETIRKRLIEHNEVLPFELRNIDEVKKIFVNEMSKVYNRCNVKVLCTDHANENDCLDYILSFINEVENKTENNLEKWELMS